MQRLTRLLAALVLGAATACTALDPPDAPREQSHALADPAGTRIEAALRSGAAAHPGESAFRLLPTGTDGFLARAALADLATKTLDVQYYIVHGDQSGGLLLERIVAAADRGVRVRLLFDDLKIAGWDDALALFDAHPMIEVRVFNPSRARGRYNPLRLAETLLDFDRLNRRMHNKIFAADNVAAIVGGRNLGDEYFEAASDLDFHDLDVLALGPIVRDVSASFDQYWNSRWAVPIAALTSMPPEREAVARLHGWLGDHRERVRESGYARELQESRFAADLEGRRMKLHWAHAAVLADDPAKIGNPEPPASLLLLPELADLPGKAQRELLVVSPYFIPGDRGVALFGRLRQTGVDVKILTNSLASIDVPVVYAAYAKYREPLVQEGVALYEFKASAGPSPRGASASTGSTRGTAGSGSGASGPGNPGGLGASSRSSLHAKTFVVDRRIVFIGSLNLDPRSVLINTEIGLRIEDPALAQEVVERFDASVRPEVAYRVEVQPLASGIDEVRWVTRHDGHVVRYDTEPETTWWQRMKTRFMGALAPDGLL